MSGRAALAASIENGPSRTSSSLTKSHWSPMNAHSPDKPAFVSSDRTAQQPSAIRPDRTGRRNRLARDRWQALEQALADFAVAALAFEQD